jgi:hypothetical protein
MPVTYKKIASVTVGAGGAASIDFTSIPGTYTDLIIHCSMRTTRNANIDDITMQFNNNTSTANYSWRELSGNGTSAASRGYTNLGGIFSYSTAATNTASTFSNTVIYIPNYAGSTQKSSSTDSVIENNATSSYMALVAGLWNQTSAITSIKFTSFNAENFVQHSTATLYGISKS